MKYIHVRKLIDGLRQLNPIYNPVIITPYVFGFMPTQPKFKYHVQSIRHLQSLIRLRIVLLVFIPSYPLLIL